MAGNKEVKGQKREWERKEHLRIPSHILVGYTLILGRKKSRQGNAIAADISGGGMYLQISDLMPPDLERIEEGEIHELELEFKLPLDSEEIKVPSEIRWVKPVKSGVVSLGVQFLNMSMKDKGKILRYMTSKFIEEGLEQTNKPNIKPR